MMEVNHTVEGPPPQDQVDLGQVIDIGQRLYGQRDPLLCLEVFARGLYWAERLRDDRYQGGCLHHLAASLRDLGELEQARSHYERAIPFHRSAGDLEGLAASESGLGHVLGRLGRHEEALKAYGRALAVARGRGDRAQEGVILTEMGVEFHELDEDEDAMHQLLAAYPLRLQAGDVSGLAKTLHYMGTTLASLGQDAAAIPSLQEALQLRLSQADPEATQETLTELVATMTRLGDRREAERLAAEVGGLLSGLPPREPPKRIGPGMSPAEVFDVARLAVYEGEDRSARPQAREAFESALRLVAPLVGDAPAEDGGPRQAGGLLAARAHLGLSRLSAVERDGEGALEHALAAHALTDSLAPGLPLHGASLAALATAQATLGDPDEAIGLFGQALELLKSQGEPPQATSAVLVNLGRCSEEVGDLQGARRAFRRALDLSTEARNERVLSLMGLGRVDQAMGELDRARAFYQQALDLTDEPLLTATCHLSLGAAYRDSANLDLALAHQGEALLVGEAMASVPRDLLAICHETIGRTSLERGDLTASRAHLEKAVELGMGISPLFSGSALTALGDLRRQEGNLEEARLQYERGLQYFRTKAPRSGEAITCLCRLASLLRPESLDAAIEHLEEAVRVAESLRLRAGPAHAREKLFAQQQSPYPLLIESLFQRDGAGDRDRAFEIAELSRARGLAELLAEREIHVRAHDEEQGSLLRAERAARHRLAAAANRLAALQRGEAAGHETLESLEAQVQAFEKDLDDLRDRIEEAFPEYGELRYPGERLKVADYEQRLASDGMILEYALTPSASFRWTIRPTGSTSTSLGRSGGDIQELVDRALARYWAGVPADEGATEAREELGRILLDGLGTLPPEPGPLLIVPDGTLAHLPFEMLPLPDGTLLGDRFVVAYAPSAAVWATLHDRADASGIPAMGGPDFVGFGDPASWPAATLPEETPGEGDDSPLRHAAPDGLRRLPGTGSEVARVARYFPARSTTYLGEEATEHHAKTRVEGARFVHFATHGILDDRNPLYSGLVMSPPAPEELTADPELDDFLQVYEMFGLPLEGVEAVVCSACQTGLGRIRGGEGLVGMSRALFFAGASCVVVTLWPVRDRPTARLMQRFYEELTRGEPAARALQRAKASVRSSHPLVYEDPYTWAAFVAVGQSGAASVRPVSYHPPEAGRG
jgi:tetratricopeptide (TPR) repeat protein